MPVTSPGLPDRLNAIGARLTRACALGIIAVGVCSGSLAPQGAGADSLARQPSRQAGSDRFTLLRDPARIKPKPASAELAGLVGEYASGSDTVIVLERGGRLYARQGEQETVALLTAFARDAGGRATSLRLGPVSLPRRTVGTEEGVVFRVTSLHPVEELRRAALAATPPPDGSPRRASDLTDLVALEPGIRLDIRYASAKNFLGAPIYSSARAFLQRPAALALVRVHRALAAYGYGLLIHDAYRPWYVTRIFWDATAGADREFVADPATGSRHNRGAAVDLTLYDRDAGKAVRMTGGYDEFSHRSYANYPGGTALERWLRDLLRREMEIEGFAVNPSEWWHFDFNGWKEYPILNVPFEQVGAKR